MEVVHVGAGGPSPLQGAGMKPPKVGKPPTLPVRRSPNLETFPRWGTWCWRVVEVAT